jgi:uncharacterized protein YndB with AHSA1/START domain
MTEHRATIDIEAAPELVFQFLVTDIGVTSWMGQWASLDPVPGGSFAVDIAGFAARGMFLEVEPPRRVTVSWGFAGSESLPPGSSTVSFELIPIATTRGAAMSDAHDDALSTVEAYHLAWTSGDVDQALTLVSDDVRCLAPDENVITKGDWHDYLTSFVPMLTGAPEHARMAHRDRVALWYFPQTATTTTTLASELFTVQGGQIVEIRLAFDRLGYVPQGQQPE